jgi:hypothetical protein
MDDLSLNDPDIVIHSNGEKTCHTGSCHTGSCHIGPKTCHTGSKNISPYQWEKLATQALRLATQALHDACLNIIRKSFS